LAELGRHLDVPSAEVVRARAETVLRFGWPVALVAALGWLLAPQDLSLGDGGFILGQSHRVLLGEVPHADFISPRPAGSVLLHTIDFLAPTADFYFSRVLAIAAIVAYSACLGLLFLNARLRTLTIPAAAAIAASAVVNHHVFPPMAWHTIDGLLFSALGFLLVDRGLRESRRRLVLLGALALGAAPLMKQSFALAPLLGLARIFVPFLLDRTRERARLVGESAAIMAVPGLAYVALVAAAGGLSEMYHELTGASPVYGETLIDVFEGPDQSTVRWIMVIGGALFALSRILGWLLAGDPLGAWLSLIARAGLTALVVWIVLDDRLEFSTPWSFRLFWLAAAITVLSSIARRAPDFGGLVTCALGWMVTLSWGLPWPAFMGGGFALYVVVRTWQDAPLPRRPRLDAAFAVASLATAALVIGTFWDIRNGDVFLTRRSTSVLTAPLGGVSETLRGIKIDSANALYLTWVKQCVERYPAKWTAVVPEDAVSGPAFGLHSPLPMDWLWPSEYQGASRERIIEAAREVGREGDYLFLFQQVTLGELYAVPPPAVLPMPRPGDEPRPFPGDPDLGVQIAASLPGRRLACGPFVAIYEPRSLQAMTSARTGGASASQRPRAR
jgi:hypothetical protein